MSFEMIPLATEFERLFWRDIVHLLLAVGLLAVLIGTYFRKP